MKLVYLSAAALLFSQSATATLLSDPNDARSWQGATVNTFATLFGKTKADVIAENLLDDGNFDPTGYVSGTLTKYNGGAPTSGNYGTSLDQPNNVSGNDSTYNYSFSGVGANVGANAVDQHWIQTNNTIGATVWDFGFNATKAAVFNTIDHGPLPQESIESTVYLSNDQINWTQAVTERVWLEGIYSDTSVLWDGFVYAVGTGTNATFRYASVIWGGPGSLHADGDNEINGIMGLKDNFTGNPTVPEPEIIGLLALALIGAGLSKRSKTH